VSASPDARRARVTAPLSGDVARTEAARRLVASAAHSAPLDRLAELARSLVATSAAQITLLAAEQTVVATAGAAGDLIARVLPLEDSLCARSALKGSALVIPDATADPRVAALPPVVDGVIAAYVGVPLRTAAGHVVGALCVFEPLPRPWSRNEVALLEQLASRVLAEVELAAVSADFEASRLRWELAIEAAGIGSFDWDLTTGHLVWDERLQSLFGYWPGGFAERIDAAFDRIHPDDRAGVEAAISDAVATCGDYRAEYRVLLPDGDQRWQAARGAVVADEQGTAVRLVGTAYDVTDARTGRDRAAHLLATMATGFLSVDRSWRVDYINAIGERVTGTRAGELVGRRLWEAFPGLEELAFGQEYKRAMATGEPVEFEAYYPHLGAWFDVRAVPSADGLALYFLDITARRESQEQSAAATARLELLADVSAELGASLEAPAAVARLAELLVPVLADWCIVTLVEEDGGVFDAGWWHGDAALRRVVERYAQVRVPLLSARSYVAQAHGSGDVALVPRGATQAVLDVLSPGEAHDLIRRLAPESLAVLPLRGRTRAVGLVSLFRDAGRPPLEGDDLVTALEVAARAGLALDNARLYDQQRSVAETLQRSLLTAPPEPDHCEIVVRYEPAAEVASVGGDWFDAFLQSDGATVLVIGDVVGHDVAAAAAMGQLRGLLRGIAWYSGAGPAEVLRGLDAAVEGLQLETTASAIVARVEQSGADLEAGVRRLRWSNAGHPPPLVLHPDSSVSVLDGPEADLLLGIDPRTDRSEATLDVESGSTVLLYTDGLVERRGQGIDEGLSALVEALATLAHLPLQELCDGLLDRLLPERGEDDVALVAVRLHPEGAARPAEAGPTSVPPQLRRDG